jgi:hypothetical protein
MLAILVWLRIARTIALVGNGPLGPGDGKAIDQHGLVVRFNSCSNYGEGGYRTDVLVLTNTGEPAEAFAHNEAAINKNALMSARAFWIARSPELVAAERKRHPDQAAYWTDYAAEIVRNRVGSSPWRFFDAKLYWWAQEALKEYGATDAHQPSTGMLALFHIKTTMWWPCHVTLFGFTHEGWDGHPWQAERALIDQWRWVCRSDALLFRKRAGFRRR